MLGVINRIDGHIARPRYGHRRSIEGGASGFEHLVHKHHHAVTGGFWTNQGATPGDAFPRKSPGFEAVGDASELAKHEPNFTGAHTNVTGRHVRIFSDVAVEFRHKGLTEPHNLTFGAAGRIEVRPTFTTADGHPGQRIFEHLFETQKLHDAQIDRRVKSDAAFIWSKCGIELDAETAVDLHDTFVVDPGHSENNLAFGCNHPAENPVFNVFGVTLHHRA